MIAAKLDEIARRREFRRLGDQARFGDVTRLLSHGAQVAVCVRAECRAQGLRARTADRVADVLLGLGGVTWNRLFSTCDGLPPVRRLFAVRRARREVRAFCRPMIESARGRLMARAHLPEPPPPEAYDGNQLGTAELGELPPPGRPPRARLQRRRCCQLLASLGVLAGVHCVVFASVASGGAAIVLLGVAGVAINGGDEGGSELV